MCYINTPALPCRAVPKSKEQNQKENNKASVFSSQVNTEANKTLHEILYLGLVFCVKTYCKIFKGGELKLKLSFHLQ